MRAERQFPVQPLALPNPAQLTDLRAIATSPAVALFIDRAESVNPAFRLDEQNCGAVAQICIWLDGLPLAIELAAEWSRVLTPQMFLARINRRLLFLDKGPRDGMEHHQTLRTAIDWSFELLSLDEQTLFSRLSIFCDSWSLAAAEAICADLHDSGIHDIEVLQHLNALIEKNLIFIMSRPHSGQRFSMLETLREYASEQLNARGEAVVLRQRANRYYQQLITTAARQLLGHEQQYWLCLLESEHANVRIVLTTLIDNGELEAALELVGAIWRFWYMHGHVREGRAWVEMVLAALDVDAPPDQRQRQVNRARALTGAAVLAYLQGDYSHALQRAQLGLAHWQRIGDPVEVAHAQQILGVVLHYQGQHNLAYQLWEECLGTFRAHTLHHSMAAVQIERGFLLLLVARDVACASQLFEESLNIAAAINNRLIMIDAVFGLGFIAYLQGQYDLSLYYIEQSLRLSGGTWHRRRCGQSLQVVAGILWHNGETRAAIRLWSAADALARALGVQLPPDYQTIYEAALTQARAGVDAAIYEDEWAIGQHMSLSQAIAYAFDCLPSPMNEP